MTSQPRQAPESAPPGTEELRAEIAQTRRELGDTVQALASKADVKTRARDTADRVKATVSSRGKSAARQARERGGSTAEHARHTAQTRDTNAMAIAGGAAAAGMAGTALAFVVLRRRHRAMRTRSMMPWNGRGSRSMAMPPAMLRNARRGGTRTRMNRMARRLTPGRTNRSRLSPLTMSGMNSRRMSINPMNAKPAKAKRMGGKDMARQMQRKMKAGRR